MVKFETVKVSDDLSVNVFVKDGQIYYKVMDIISEYYNFGHASQALYNYLNTKTCTGKGIERIPIGGSKYKNYTAFSEEVLRSFVRNRSNKLGSINIDKIVETCTKHFKIKEKRGLFTEQKPKSEVTSSNSHNHLMSSIEKLFEKEFSSREERLIKENQELRELVAILEKKVVELKKEFGDTTEYLKKTTYMIEELSADLSNNGINMGRNNLYKYMRDHGFLCTSGSLKNFPTQKGKDLSLFVVRHNVHERLLLTTKGLIYFMEKFLEGKYKEKEAREQK